MLGYEGEDKKYGKTWKTIKLRKWWKGMVDYKPRSEVLLPLQ